MSKILTPQEQQRANSFREQIIRKVQAYVILRDNADTKRYEGYADTVEKMLLTGNYDKEKTVEAVSNESLFLERFAAIDRAYNEVNALTHAYTQVFPESPLPKCLENALQDMRTTHKLGLSTILSILEDRTEQLLTEIKK